MQQELILPNISSLSLFETSKEQRTIFCNDIVGNLLDGKIDALKVHLQIKCMEDIVKQLTTNQYYKDAVLDAANKCDKGFSLQHAKFEVKEMGIKFDYSVCNDETLQKLEAIAEDTDKTIKERQAFLKTVPDKGLDIITTEGEVVTIFKPNKTSTTTVVVNLK